MRFANRPFMLGGLLLLAIATALEGQAAGRRRLTIDDLTRLREVEDPQLSPDGRWVAYTVTTPDLKRDQQDSDIWMTSWDGARSLRLTTSPESEHTPRWSPDGTRLAFLSSRDDKHEADQLWLLNVAGGEAERLTELRHGISDFAWAPDGRRMVLAIQDGDSVEVGAADTTEAGTAPPIVIDRFHFKQDIEGYRRRKRTHLYLLDLATRKLEILTPGGFDELMPSWSPDGRFIAFVSKHGPDPDRTNNWDLFVVEPAAGATPRQLTTFEGADNDPEYESPLAWSPDGKYIAFIRGGAPKLIYYAVNRLAIVPVDSGPARILTPDLDRSINNPRWSSDGESILFSLEDDQARDLAKVALSTGRIERIVTGRRVVAWLSGGPDDHWAVLASTALTPAEVYAVDGQELRPLSRQNDAWLSEVQLGAVEEIHFKSRDGTPISGFVVTPPEGLTQRPYATILRIHGGPVSQYEDELQLDWQIMAARGYAVVAANPRGSSGRGEKFATAIYADWGNRDVRDVLAAVDDVVARGIADPARLGVGGWSYGGILTNYVIASDTRFKAATSGAGASNILAGYGTDMYVKEYEAELGTPWTSTATWLRLSFPFLHADRVMTPTLFLCSEKDFNVPCLNAEQMYQALRSLGRKTELVIYPGQFHDLTKPSYLIDRLRRYLQWYDRFLMGE